MLNSRNKECRLQKGGRIRRERFKEAYSEENTPLGTKANSAENKAQNGVVSAQFLFPPLYFACFDLPSVTAIPARLLPIPACLSMKQTYVNDFLDQFVCIGLYINPLKVINGK